MSEKRRKTIGVGLMILTAALIAAGFFPQEQSRSYHYTGRGMETVSLSPVIRLSAEDPVNNGNTEELEKLPGVGPVIAESILAERKENGPFIYPEDLISVKGIGENKMKQIRPMLTTISGESEE